MQAELPEALGFLFEPARYKVAYGGRGGAKSWGFARALLIQGWQKPLRVLCAREFQNSIKDSVHKLLADQVKQMGMESTYDIQDKSIKNRNNGTEFYFIGLRHNSENVRSYEGVDRVWVEEAKNVSKASWETLIPTIRKEDSEIWVSFNPELETDETYKRFVVNPPPNAIVRKVNYRDNPWFPKVLLQELETLKERDPDSYMNVWEGSCRITLHGAIYAQELRAATLEKRITKVPYDESQPVHTFWDLGWSDCTSIWFAQKVGFEYRLIDYYQNRLQKLSHYLKMLQDRGYIYGKHYLPHDAASESLASDSIEKTIAGVYGKSATVVVPRVTDKINGLKATREIFARCYFDEVKCADGLQALRHYRYDVDEHGQFSKDPLHDENSHGADAFETFARSINRRIDTRQVDVEYQQAYESGQQEVAWMAT
jgi:phage terminase large subunit